MQSNSILGDLLRHYIRDGAPFAFVHLCLLVWFGIELRRVILEKRALETWKPSERGSATCTAILARFVTESEQLSTQGFLVPVTDFTDRLDSVVGGMVGRIHDLINLFLVVGIAGTVFGLFRFALQAAGAGTDVSVLGAALSAGLRTAFPVAFVGLFLYALGYALASIPEHSLLQSLAKATDLALEKRRALAKSQADVIREALAPLKNLETTLSKAVQPAIEGFQHSLNEAFELVKSQMGVLQQAVNAVQVSVQSVEKGVQSLKEVSEHLRLVLADAPAMLKKIDDLHGQQVKRLEELSQTIETVGKSSTETIQKLGATADRFSLLLEAFQGLPQQLRQELASGVADLFSGTVQQLNAVIHQFEGLPLYLKDSVQAALDEVKQRLRDVGEGTITELRQRVMQLIGTIEESTGKANRSLEDAATRLNDVAHQAHEILGKSFDEAIAAVTKEAKEWLPRLDDMFVNKVPTALEETGRAVEGLKQLVSQLDSARRKLQELLDAIDSRRLPDWATPDTQPILDEVRACANEVVAMRKLIGIDGTGDVLSSLADMESKVLQRLDQLVQRPRPRPPWQFPWWPRRGRN